MSTVHPVPLAPWSAGRPGVRLPLAAPWAAPSPRPLDARDWADVRVEAVTLEPPAPQAAGADAVDAMRGVLACVQLGRLLPADVEVHLVRADAGADDRPAHGAIVRLWSRHPYGNGAYLFEARVPAALLAGDRFEVHVTPRGGERAPGPRPVGVRRLVPRADARPRAG